MGGWSKRGNICLQEWHGEREEKDRGSMGRERMVGSRGGEGRVATARGDRDRGE